MPGMKIEGDGKSNVVSLKARTEGWKAWGAAETEGRERWRWELRQMVQV